MSLSRSRLLVTALIVSVAINLLIVGGWVGHELSGKGPPRSTPQSLGWLIDPSNPGVRSQMRERLQGKSGQIGELRGNVRAAQRNFNELAMAEPLDEAAVRASLAEIRTANLAFQEMMHAEMVDIIGELDGRDRRKAIRYLQARTRVEGRRHDRGPRGRERNRDRDRDRDPAPTPPGEPDS